MPSDGLIMWNISRYEDEINKRTEAENDFVLIKKVSADGFLTPTLHY